LRCCIYQQLHRNTLEGRRMSLDEVIGIVAEFVRQNYQDFPEELRVTMRSGKQIRLPIPVVLQSPPVKVAPAASEEPEAPEEEWIPFQPSPFQRGILKALEGKAYRTDALGAVVGDRGRLFKKHGLRELVDRGLVCHSTYHGYYRPDSPPAGIEIV